MTTTLYDNDLVEGEWCIFRLQLMQKTVHFTAWAPVCTSPLQSIPLSFSAALEQVRSSHRHPFSRHHFNTSNVHFQRHLNKSVHPLDIHFYDTFSILLHSSHRHPFSRLHFNTSKSLSAAFELRSFHGLLPLNTTQKLFLQRIMCNRNIDGVATSFHVFSIKLQHHIVH
jgi:hypothetical protein